ncbi:MAG: hypothetical protein GWP05_00690 [Anaerolineaceae bacterium]|nr:hypothetical protein [Anaerolineaceae bacterium]
MLNNITVFPSQGSPQSRKVGGTVFSFAKEKFSSQPELSEKEFTVEKFFQELKGDIYYAVPEGGAFVVKSGRIADLGKHYLYEFNGKDPPRPTVIYGKEDGKKTPGLVTGLKKKNGHCYLLETAGGKYALLRIISQDIWSARIQWVYQPDGKRKFTIPKGEILREERSAGAVRPNEKGPSDLSIMALDFRDFAKAATAHVENRKRFVEFCLKVLGNSRAQIDNRSLACQSLGTLRVPEAAPTLASLIDKSWGPGWGTGSRVTIRFSYPCLQALIKIGLPGAQAALKQIEVDSLSELPGRERRDIELWRRQERLKMLTIVIVKIYGERLAKVVLEDKIMESKDPRIKAAFEESLKIIPQVRKLFPDKEKKGKK